MTHTYAIAEVSSACYVEVKALVLEAGYTQAVHVDKGVTVLDMHGIALRENTLITNAEVAQKQRWYDDSLKAFQEMERERDAALRKIDFVVDACLRSREVEKSMQAVMLRDEILSHVDPVMLITQRLRNTPAENL